MFNRAQNPGRAPVLGGLNDTGGLALNDPALIGKTPPPIGTLDQVRQMTVELQELADAIAMTAIDLCGPLPPTAPAETAMQSACVLDDIEISIADARRRMRMANDDIARLRARLL